MITIYFLGFITTQNAFQCLIVRQWVEGIFIGTLQTSLSLLTEEFKKKNSKLTGVFVDNQIWERFFVLISWNLYYLKFRKTVFLIQILTWAFRHQKKKTYLWLSHGENGLCPPDSIFLLCLLNILPVKFYNYLYNHFQIFILVFKFN